MNFNTPTLDRAVADFKALFGAHVSMFEFGQFYVTNRTMKDLLFVVEAEIRGHLRLQFAKPAELAGIVAFFEQHLGHPPEEVDVAVISALLDQLEIDGDLAPIRQLFQPGKQDRANAQRDFDVMWKGSDIPSAPPYSSSPPTLGKARAAKQLENDRCHQVVQAMSRKTLKARGVAALPPGATFSAGTVGNATPVERAPASATEVAQQVLRYPVPGQLVAGVQRMKAALDAGGQVHCGVLSGARHEHSKFPEPEHHIVALAHDQVGGMDAFVFWDPDSAHSNIKSAHWGAGFGVLFATPTRLSTATDDADLAAIDRRERLPTRLRNNGFGDHLGEPRRHCYQVYFVQTLPMSATVKVRTTVVAPPKRASMDDMIRNAGELFASQDIEVIEASREDVSSADGDLDRFRTVFVGDGDSPTSDVTDLHAALRADTAGLGVEPEPSDVVVAVVEDLVPAASGWNRHPVEQPGVVLSASLAGPWTLAHELGHVLGLDHDADPSSLMYDGAVPDGGDAPVLSDAQADTVTSRLSSPA